MAILDGALQTQDLPPETRLALENLFYSLSKGLEADNIKDGALTAALVDPGAPAAPTSLTLASSGTYQATDGPTRAYSALSWTNPPAGTFGDVALLYRINGTTDWNFAGRTTGTTGRIDGLTPGRAYDYGVQAITVFNVASTVATLLNQVAPGDTTAPGVPTGLAIIDQKLTTIAFQWIAPSDSDVRGYDWDIRTASAGGGSVVKSGFVEGTTLTLDVASIGYTVTRYARVRAKDFTGNVSSYTASLSFIFNEAQTVDIDDNQVTNPKINNQAIDENKRITVYSDSRTLAPGAQSGGVPAFVTSTITHNLGRECVGICHTTLSAAVWTLLRNVSTNSLQVKGFNGETTSQTYTNVTDYW